MAVIQREEVILMDRKTIKERAKSNFLANYWPTVGIFAILAAIMGMGSGLSGSSSSLINSLRSVGDNLPQEVTGALYIVFGSIGLVMSTIGLVVIIFLSNPFTVTNAHIALGRYDGERANFGELFYCFKNRRYWRYVGTMALYSLFGMLIMIGALVITGIVCGVGVAVSMRTELLEYTQNSVNMAQMTPFLVIGIVTIMLAMIPFTIVMIGFSRVPYILAEDDAASGMSVLRRSWSMMRGHKWEYFVFELSFFGWQLLNILSFGIAGVFFIQPYMIMSLAGYHRELTANTAA